jgi:gamma-glutamylcyclotransferase (GGCT)/AIG2-like uncharacterized protein YtfP
VKYWHVHEESENERLQVFVYGTLLPGEVNYELLLRGRTRGEARRHCVSSNVGER